MLQQNIGLDDSSHKVYNYDREKYLLGSVYMSKDAYTDNQLKIVNGEIPLASVRSTALSKILKKAILWGDLEIAEKIEFNFLRTRSRLSFQHPQEYHAFCLRYVFHRSPAL